MAGHRTGRNPPKWSPPLQNPRDRLDLVTRVDRQSGTERFSGIEAALSGQHLERYQISQHRDLRIFLALHQDIGFDRERHEDRNDRLIRLARMRLEHGQKLAELHDLIDVENALLKRTDRGGIKLS